MRHTTFFSHFNQKIIELNCIQIFDCSIELTQTHII